MRKLFFWLLAVFLVVSCSATAPGECDLEEDPIPMGSIERYTIVVKPSVPADKVSGIVDGAAAWSRTTSGRVTYDLVYRDFDITEKPPIGEIRVYLGPPDPLGKRIGSTGWWNVDSHGRPGRAVIWIDETLNDHVNFLVAMHEFGHAIGLPHTATTEKQPSIMYPYITDVGDEPTCYDHQTACRIWECDVACPQ